MDLFRHLSKEEEAEFRKWARDNYKRGEPVNEVWHPVVRDECAKMNEVVSYAAEVIADNSGKFCGNSLRFTTRAEAEVYAKDLMRRWTLVREWRVVESSDPVTEKSQ